MVNKQVDQAIQKLTDVRSDLYMSRTSSKHMAYVDKEMSEIKVDIDNKIAEVERRFEEAKDQRSQKTLDKMRSILKSISKDLEYVSNTLNKTAARNPLLNKVVQLAKQGKTEDEIAETLQHEDAEVVGDAIVQAKKQGHFKSRLARIVERIVAFKSPTKFGSGGCVIRPDGTVIPVDYAGHSRAAYREIETQGLLPQGKKPYPSAFEFLKDQGYIIVHNTPDGWDIEYDKSEVDKGNLRDLVDYFMIHHDYLFNVYSGPGPFETVQSAEDLEQVLDV